MIIVDHREQRSIVPKQLEHLKVEFRYETLPVGDYVIGEHVFERKDAGDFAQSLISGHLNNQLYQMSFNFEVSTIIIEGYMSEVLMHRQLKREVYLSSLAGTIFRRAPDGKQGIINMVATETPYDTAIFLKHYLHKTEDQEPRLPKMERIKLSDQDRLKYLISGFPNIGPIKAQNLIDKFKSLNKLTNASYEEIKSVKGFGDTNTKRLYHFIHNEVT